jgi:hypothetical protein
MTAMYKSILKKILRQTTLLFISGTVLGYTGSILGSNADWGYAIALLGLGLILCAVLSTHHSFVRRFLLDNEELERLISQLQTGNPQQRRAAARKLGLSKNPMVVSALIRAYDDMDDAVHRNVIAGLANIASEEATEFLNSKEIPVVSKAEVPLRTDVARIVIFLVMAPLCLVLWFVLLSYVSVYIF